MKKRKMHISTLILLILLVVCFFYRGQIVSFVMGHIVQNTKVNAPNDNEYALDYSFEFVQKTDNFHVKNKQDILNVIYTVLNSGENKFTFFCDINYDDCRNDLKEVSDDQMLLSVINNMVSPYNSYEKLYITINSYGEARIDVKYLYSESDISSINAKIAEIEGKVITENMSLRDKIKAFHDYIVNNSLYDQERADQIEKGEEIVVKYNSHKASGPLIEGYALCSGYSDAMKLYLDKLNVVNYKVSNEKHIWNALYIDGKWLYIDRTGDDPVAPGNPSILMHDFFLVSTDELAKLDTTNHKFNRNYYLELK